MYLNWDNHVKYKTDVNFKKFCRTSFFQLIIISVDDIWAWLLFKLNKKKPIWKAEWKCMVELQNFYRNANGLIISKSSITIGLN